MQSEISPLNRRAFLAGIAAAGCSVIGVGSAEGKSPRRSLFDGKTLDGWAQIENSATTLSGGGITDQSAFVNKLAIGSDAVSVFLRSRLEDTVKTDLTAYSPSNANAKGTISALAKDLNQIIAGPPIYDNARFSNTVLRPETEQISSRIPAASNWRV